MIAERLLVRGRVQGVGFRWFVRAAAEHEGLAGWVRNLPDGDVEIAVAGEREAVEQFVARVRRGPSGARVDTVDRGPLSPAEPLERPFAIVR